MDELEGAVHEEGEEAEHAEVEDVGPAEEDCLLHIARNLCVGEGESQSLTRGAVKKQSWQVLSFVVKPKYTSYKLHITQQYKNTMICLYQSSPPVLHICSTLSGQTLWSCSLWPPPGRKGEGRGRPQDGIGEEHGRPQGGIGEGRGRPQGGIGEVRGRPPGHRGEGRRAEL